MNLAKRRNGHRKQGRILCFLGVEINIRQQKTPKDLQVCEIVTFVQVWMDKIVQLGSGLGSADVSRLVHVGTLRICKVWLKKPNDSCLISWWLFMDSTMVNHHFSPPCGEYFLFLSKHLEQTQDDEIWDFEMNLSSDSIQKKLLKVKKRHGSLMKLYLQISVTLHPQSLTARPSKNDDWKTPSLSS